MRQARGATVAQNFMIIFLVTISENTGAPETGTSFVTAPEILETFPVCKDVLEVAVLIQPYTGLASDELVVRV